MKTLAQKFAEWVEDGYCRSCDETNVVETQESSDNFYNALRECRSKDADEFKGMPVMVLEGTQRFKGETRTDLFILDAGDKRLVLSI